MAGEQWYLAIGGQQVGPMSEADVVQGIQAGTVDAKTLVFSAGMSNWTPLAAVPQLAQRLDGAGSAAAGTGIPAVPTRQAHEIDFKIYGNEMPVRRGVPGPWRERRG